MFPLECLSPGACHPWQRLPPAISSTLAIVMPRPSSPDLNQSITSAHASVGAAATPPTTGTILMTADVTRQGAAARPQPAQDRQSREISNHFMGDAPADVGTVGEARVQWEDCALRASR